MDKVTAPVPPFVGIDVSKRRLDVHSRPSGESFAIDHDEEGMAVLVGRLTGLEPALIVLEATGGMEPTRGGRASGRPVTPGATGPML